MSIWSNIYFSLLLDSTSHTYFIICNKNTNNIPSQIFEFSLKLQCVVVSSITGGLYKKQFPVEFYYTARWRELSKATLQTGLSSLSLWEITKLLLVSKLKPFLLGERSSDRNWKPSNTLLPPPPPPFRLTSDIVSSARAGVSQSVSPQTLQHQLGSWQRTEPCLSLQISFWQCFSTCLSISLFVIPTLIVFRFPISETSKRKSFLEIFWINWDQVKKYVTIPVVEPD